MGDQRYMAWFTEYPTTHELAGQTVEVVPRSELERVEAERDLALKALGHDSYEAAQQYLTSVLSGPAPVGWADQR